MWSAVIILTVSALLTVTSAQNDFDAIQGCKQYSINRPSYNNPHPYFALDQFRDVQQVEIAGLKIRSIKLGVMGTNDGVIRLSPVDQPYQNTLMDEIVLSGWGNTRNAVRQYVRSSPSRYTRNVFLVNQLSGGILSPYKPFVFTLSIVNDHLVALSKAGESLPFLQYTDAGVNPKYIGFSNWNAPISVFYDCPPPPPPPPPPPTTQQPQTTSTTVEPTVNPVVPTDDPAVPTDAPVDPTDAPVEPTDAPVEPTDDPAVPTDDPVENTDDPAVPTDDPVENTDDPVENTDDPAVPTDDPVENTDDPTVPTDDPIENTDNTTVPTDDPEVTTDDPEDSTNDPTVSTQPTEG